MHVLRNKEKTASAILFERSFTLLLNSLRADGADAADAISRKVMGGSKNFARGVEVAPSQLAPHGTRLRAASGQADVIPQPCCLFFSENQW